MNEVTFQKIQQSKETAKFKSEISKLKTEVDKS